MSSENEEMIDYEINIDKETADFYAKMTKKELTNRLYISILKLRVQTETINEYSKEQKELEYLLEQSENRKSQSEEHTEQARVMINALMERWYNYE